LYDCRPEAGAADVGRGVELAFACAGFGGEMPHQVFVSVTENGVVVGAFRGEVEIGFPEGGAGGASDGRAEVGGVADREKVAST
jgi:hypothetical protein